jgi:hypothetical protein
MPLLKLLLSHLIAVATLTTPLCAADTTTRPRPGKLSFGWAHESIVPDKPVAIAGQYNTRISGDVLDPITVTALAIETRDDKGVIDQAVWVSCDMVAVRRTTVDGVRKKVAASLPDLDPRKIIVSATHTHTAPAITDEAETDFHPYDFVGSWAYRIPADQQDVIRPREYLEFLEQQIAKAVVAAWQSRKPGEFGSALGHASVARNRRAVFFDGTTRMYGDTKDPGFSHLEGTSDDSIDLLCFWREGRLIGMAVTVYCPSQETEGLSALSADFWHETRRLLKELHSPDLFVLGLTGAAGDQSPHIMIDKVADKDMLDRRKTSSRQEIARRIANAVQEVLEVARGSMRSDVTFVHSVENIALPVWKVDEPRFALSTEVFEAGRDKVAQLSSPDYINWRVHRTMLARHKLQQTDPFYRPEIHAIRLNDLAIATNPFELYTDYGLRMKARSPATHTSIVQLTADCAAYLPTERAVQGGGYSGRIDDGVVGPEGGRVLVEETMRMFGEMWPARK